MLGTWDTPVLGYCDDPRDGLSLGRDVGVAIRAVLGIEDGQELGTSLG